MEKFIFKSATTLAELIRTGKATSKEIVMEHLERIKTHDEKYRALVMLFEKEALETAAECDREALEGKFRGPLHGVPVTIKEAFWIKGIRSTINLKLHKNFIAPEDAVTVDRIRRSGAVILGKTNIPAGLMDYQVNGELYPEAKNPYHPDYTPGGSTGGGAAALAAGFSALELGSDIGGSIRLPSNFCGLYGLKPTDKAIPGHGMMPIPKNSVSSIMHMATPGPLARTPDDLELLWKILVGPHESNRETPRIDWNIPVKGNLADYRIAWTDGWPGHPASATVKAAIRGFVAALQQKGVHTEQRIPDETLHSETLNLYVSLFPYVISQGAPALIRFLMRMQFRSTLLKGVTKYNRLMRSAFRMDAGHYGEVMVQKAALTQRWESFFRDVDLLICPMAFGPAFERTKIGTRISFGGEDMPYLDYVWPFTACFNASGNPALNIPLGLNPDGLPLGVQVVGPWWSEPELIRFANLSAGLTPGFIPPPLSVTKKGEG